VKATGKAVEKALGIAVVMMKERDWAVQVRTGSVCAIDDVIIEDNDELEAEDIAMQDDGGEKDRIESQEGGADEIPETRIRFTSMIEIEVRLRTDEAVLAK